MSIILPIDTFLTQTSSLPILDVRSPSEYQSGHIPRAINLPLLNDEERHLTGLAYALQGKSHAVRGALEMVGPKMSDLVDKALKIAIDGKLAVYCFRGGMRSQSMAWLLETAGLNVVLLEGGYKAWRRFALALLAKPKLFIVLTGHTGCGKTEILNKLQSIGEQIIDLEGIASHRGSVFGAIGLPNQPSSEHFGNLLAIKCMSLDYSKPIFIESESIRIGNVQIDSGFFMLMEKSPAICIKSPKNERIARILKEYATDNHGLFVEAFRHINRRLGDENTQKAINAVMENRLSDAVSIALNYYDTYYNRQLEMRNKEQLLYLDTTGLELIEIAHRVIELKNTLYE